MPVSSSSSASTHPKPRKHSHPTNPNTPATSTTTCKHSPSATLDVLILILVLFSCTFLVTSYFTYIFHSLSQILPPLSLSLSLPATSPLLYILLFATLSILTLEICFSYRSRKCEKPGCKGLKNALEFDIKLETEGCLRENKFDGLPWKGGTALNPDYDCLRSELRKMAPFNGRAILLFRAKCGCPLAKLEAWGAKKARRHNKALSNVVPKGGGNKR